MGRAPGEQGEYGPPPVVSISPHLARVALNMEAQAAESFNGTEAAIVSFGDTWQPTFVAPDETPPAFFRVGLADLAAKTRPVLMGGLGAGHISLPSDRRSLQIVQNALIRTSASVDADRLEIHGWVPHGEYVDFNELGASRFQHIPFNGLEAEIDRLARLQTELRSGQRSRMGVPGRPWNILLIDDSSLRLSDRARMQLEYLASGTEWGMLITRGIAPPGGDLVQRETPDERHVECVVDAPTRLEAQRMIRQIASSSSKEKPSFESAEIDEGPLGVQSTANGIRLVLGQDTRNGRHPILELGDDGMAHVVISATTSWGKSILLARALKSAAKYDPDELDIYYIDAAGPDAAIFGRSLNDEDDFALLNLLATSVTDPEFVADALKGIERTIAEREAMLTRMGYRNLTELRRDRPDLHMPRILLVLDEVPRLFEYPEIVARVSNIVNTGRKLGVHVIMATLPPSGAAGRGIDKILPMFGWRIALNGGQWLMARSNHSPEYTGQISTKGVAWINKNLGEGPADKNMVVRVPFVQPDDIRQVKRRLAQATRAKVRKRLVRFDSGERPRLETSVSYTSLSPVGREPVTVFVGQQLSVDKRAATADFDDKHGNNLLILGTDDEATSEAVAVAARSVARQHRPGDARISIVCPNNGRAASATNLARRLFEDGHDVRVYDGQDVEAFMTETVERLGAQSPQRKHYVFVVDSDRMSGAAGEALKELADQGPVRGVHLTAVTGSQDQLERAWGRDHRRSPRQLFESRLVMDAPHADIRELLGNGYAWDGSRPHRAALSRERGGVPEVVVLYE